MTSADEFVIQLIIDKELVSADTVDVARSEVAQDQECEDEDGALIDLLVSRGHLTH